MVAYRHAVCHPPCTAASPCITLHSTQLPGPAQGLHFAHLLHAEQMVQLQQPISPAVRLGINHKRFNLLVCRARAPAVVVLGLERVRPSCSAPPLHHAPCTCPALVAKQIPSPAGAPCLRQDTNLLPLVSVCRPACLAPPSPFKHTCLLRRSLPAPGHQPAACCSFLSTLPAVPTTPRPNKHTPAGSGAPCLLRDIRCEPHGGLFWAEVPSPPLLDARCGLPGEPAGGVRRAARTMELVHPQRMSMRAKRFSK